MISFSFTFAILISKMQNYKKYIYFCIKIKSKNEKIIPIV